MPKNMKSALPALMPLLVAAAVVTSAGCATSSDTKTGASESNIESSACREAVRTCMQEFPDVPETCITGIDLGSEEAKTEVYNCLANGGGGACADKCVDSKTSGEHWVFVDAKSEQFGTELWAAADIEESQVALAGEETLVADADVDVGGDVPDSEVGTAAVHGGKLSLLGDTTGSFWVDRVCELAQLTRPMFAIGAGGTISAATAGVELVIDPALGEGAIFNWYGVSSSLSGQLPKNWKSMIAGAAGNAYVGIGFTTGPIASTDLAGTWAGRQDSVTAELNKTPFYGIGFSASASTSSTTIGFAVGITASAANLYPKIPVSGSASTVEVQFNQGATDFVFGKQTPGRAAKLSETGLAKWLLSIFNKGGSANPAHDVAIYKAARRTPTRDLSPIKCKKVSN